MSERSIGKQITHVARYLNRCIDLKTAHLGVGSATIPFLTYLYEHDGIHQEEMAVNLQFDKSSVTRAVKALEQKGYVRKTVDPEVKRKNRLTVTSQGLGIRDELHEILRQSTREVFRGFSPGEIAFYFKFTEKINRNIERIISELKR